MKTALIVAREVLADLVKLNLPVTAAATATLLVGVVAPFYDLSAQTKAITAALAALGLGVSYVQKVLARTRAAAPTKLRG